MKQLLKSLSLPLLFAVAIFSCKKDNVTPPAVTKTGYSYDTYSSLQNFYAANGIPLQTYTVSGTAGGSFTTAKGTKVIIPANCFIDQSGNKVSGTVTIEFKDIYSKTDMIFSQVLPVSLPLGRFTPLNSGGEFYIRAKSGGKALQMSGAGPIKVIQPFNWFPKDNLMKPFLGTMDSTGFPNDSIGNTGANSIPAWTPDSVAYSVTDSVSSYVFSFYRFAFPVDSGTWCNSDDSYYFSAYTQVPFTIATTDDSIRWGNCDVYLLFSGLNSMVHVYYSGTTGNESYFPYGFAPQGMKCTVVTLEVRNSGQFRAAFIPNVTISKNDTVKFTTTPMTTANFKAQLSTYNH